MVRRFLVYFHILALVFGLISSSGCVKQTLILDSATNAIKDHQRLRIHASRPQWTKTDIAVKQGDHILIIASGRVITRQIRDFEMPYERLYMKYGRRGYPLNAVGFDDFKFLRASGAGRLMFCVNDWSYLDSKGRPVWYDRRSGTRSTSFPDLGKYWYRDNSGSFVVDVFVFSTPDENLIALALDAVARANPDDHELVSKVRQIADFKRPSRPANQSEKTNEVSPANPELSNLELYKPQLAEGKGDTSIGNQGVLLKSVFQMGHASTVTSVALSPDDNLALFGGKDNTLRLWEVATAREIRVFKGHTDYVYSVAFSPDGKTAVSGSTDNTLRLWAVSTGIQIRVLRGHTDAVTSAVFSQDGEYILSGSRDRTLRLWKVQRACRSGFLEDINPLSLQ